MDNNTKIKSKFYLCPHCGNELQINVRVEIDDVIEPLLEADSWKRGLSLEQVSIVDQAETTGILSAFTEAAMQREGSGQTPRDFRKFFITFLKTCGPKRIAPFALNHLISTHGGQIHIWCAQGIAAVMSDGKVVQFIPTVLMNGRGVGGITSSGGIKTRLPADENKFYEWVRTKHGYAIKGSLLFDELRKKSIGEFAKLGF